MQTVGEIMTKELLTVEPEDSVARVAELMERAKVGGLPVVEDGRLVGIITSRDIRRCHPNRLIADAMTREVVTVRPACSLWEAKDLLERHGIERLVAVEGDHPVGVVTKSALYAELGKHTDALTGLQQAEAFQRKALELLRDGKEIAIVFLDLDNFGAVDKELGHVEGDKVLCKVAKVLSSVVEEDSDHLFRYAGDEFAVVTVKPLEEARKLALRMVNAISEEEWPPGIKVAASAGVAGGRRASPRQGGLESYAVSDLINMASLASTKAKKEGRQVVVAGEIELREVDCARQCPETV
ncbi:MAG: CBS domain-containing protein [Firmicutes bacterium]|nr:CBS domain-containing protein [Bacillota bacterium]